MTDTIERVRILCVDDEPRALSSLCRILNRQFRVITARDGLDGLDVIRNQGPFAVIVSDMRMPKMNGIAFLARAKEIAPDSVRILLTGHVDVQVAICAVNEGGIFRFLEKPCRSETLRHTIADAVEQNRLITAERVLLERTLRGSIQMLTDVLSMANPAAFGRATRIRNCVVELARHLNVGEQWAVEVAAMLSQIGYVTLPPDLIEKLNRGEPLGESERHMVDRLLIVPVLLLENIPRMDPVREILAYREKLFDGSGRPPDDAEGEAIPLGARLLKVAVDFDALESSGMKTGLAIETLASRTGWYDPTVIRMLAWLKQDPETTVEARGLSVDELRTGMVFFEDVKTLDGVLLVTRGQEVTSGIRQRLQNFALNVGVKEPLWIAISKKHTAPLRTKGTIRLSGTRPGPD